MIGETIKGFRITGRLGQGGMGEVWIAEQELIKTRVAIKLLLPELSTDQQLVQRFFNEAIAVSRIRHAGIVKIYDVGFHRGSAFLIMELLEGETLAARLRRGRLPLGQIGDLGRQIASILDATHAAHITHRDLKPENIYLVPDAELASGERVKILDFGIAKLGTTVGLTGIGGMMGTPGYMAPEQWSDAARADGRADVYAVGCITFEMCCGQPPFVVSTVHEAYAKHVHEVPPRARSLAPTVPAEVDELIARMLAKQPADRPSLKELLWVFASVAAKHPGSSSPPPVDETRVSPGRGAQPPDTTLQGAAASARTGSSLRRRRIAALAGGAVVAVAGLGVGGYVLVQRGTTPAAGSSAVRHVEPPAPDAGAPAGPPPADPAPAPANHFVSILPPRTPIALGVDDDKAPASIRGFRRARGILSPSDRYEIQEHEVTWGEIEPWLARTHTRLEFPPWAKDPVARALLPVTGITWATALSYCQSLGGSLPTEEQWEYAARGPERRPNSWGADRLDRSLTPVYRGPGAIPAAVKTSVQDRTPMPVIYDLIGNVQEWTQGLWREDLPGVDESWVSAGATTVRAIRGLPLGDALPPTVQSQGAAYREQRCAEGPCVDKYPDVRRYVGFRCARPPR